jgi:hypothetical protein
MSEAGSIPNCVQVKFMRSSGFKMKAAQKEELVSTTSASGI